MNRKLRITFRNGDVRMCGLPPDRSLLDVVTIFRRDGWIMGDVWCAPCTSDNIAMIEVVEMAADVPLGNTAPSQLRPIDDDSVKRLAFLAGAGIFKPPGEA